MASMDTRKHSISYASFITKTYCWLFFYLQRKGALKHVALLLVVLVCTLTRYAVLSFDKAEARQIKINSVDLKSVKIRLESAKVNLKSELSDMKHNYQHKIKPLNFKRVKNDRLYIYAIN